MTYEDVMSALECSRRDVTYLSRSGLLGTTPLGKREFFASDDVDNLRAFGDLSAHPSAVLARVAPAARDEDHPDRDWRGYSVRYQGVDPRHQERTRRDALRGWYPVASPRSHIGDALVISLAGFIVAVFDIVGVDGESRFGRRQARFEVADATDAQREAFERRRVPPQRGGVASVLPPVA